MKLTDLIYRVSSAVRDATNFARYPVQIISQRVRNIAQARIEEIDLPIRSGQTEHEASPPPSETRKSWPEAASAVSPYAETEPSSVAVITNNAALPEPKEALPLLEGRKLIGRRGRYHIEKMLKDDEQSRLYQGFWLANNTPVTIKEYQLSQFNSREVEQNKDKLERLDSVNLKSGGVQDFRLIAPWDTFIDVERKCGYVIKKQALKGGLTLREFLNREILKGNPEILPQQVRQVLSQVLQTLWFLHNHTIRFSNGAVQQGVAHGNLNLDSLLIVQNELPIGPTETQFYIYVDDLSLWREPFQAVIKPAKSTPSTAWRDQMQLDTSIPDPTNLISKDLVQLGVLGFYLLVGEVDDGHPDRFADPKAHPKWATIPDQPFKDFIRQLMGLDRSVSFDSAEAARKVLDNLPKDLDLPTIEDTAPPTAPPHDRRWMPLLVFLLTIITMGLISWISWQFLTQSRSNLVSAIEGVMGRDQPSTFRDIEDSDFLPRRFTYAVSSLWRDVLLRGRVSLSNTFPQELADRDPRLNQYILEGFEPIDQSTAMEKLQSGQLDFVLGHWHDQLQAQGELAQGELAQGELTQEIVAYDGLVFFVAFSDPQREQSIPVALNGKITFEQLRQLYTGEANWDPPRVLMDWNVNLYAPLDWDAIELFERDVLKNDPTIQVFRQFLGERIQWLSMNQIFGKVLADFEDRNTIGIGFGRLSKVFGQCSVYPLMVGEAGQEVQALTESNGSPISPELDLCDAKGSYAPDSRVFENQNYPLIYRLSVIYLKNEGESQQAAETFIKALKTDEGQCLLNEAGLVPIFPVEQAGVCNRKEW